MSNIHIYRIRPRRLKGETLSEMAKALNFEGKLIETEEAMAIQDSTRTLVYAQPGSKFGGLLFFTDQSSSLAGSVEKLVDRKNAQSWTNNFLKSFDLLPEKVTDELMKFNLKIRSYQTQAVTFGGKERKKSTIKTEIASNININDVPVVGPRAKIRMTFKDSDLPVFIHSGLWKAIEIHEERELIDKSKVLDTVKEKLTSRQDKRPRSEIKSVKLAYFAQEYNGGPDLLMPFYFVEIEQEDKNKEKLGITNGIKQMIWIPAYR